MYQIGLKLWSTNTDTYLREAERLYADGFFSYIELYVVPGSLECLPAWKTVKIPFLIHNAHFMQHFNLADRERAESNRKIYEETRRFADALNARWIIFHGGIDGNIEETARQLSAFREPRALIENKPFRALPNRMGGYFCRGYDVKELKRVMDASGCGFCLDFGHAVCAANSLRREPYSYIEELTTLGPTMYHLTDVNDMTSEYDSHPHLGQGELNLGRIFSLIPEKAVITVETQKNSKESLNDFSADSTLVKFYDLECAPATMADARCIFELSNDPLVRQNSFCQEQISWEEHLRWLEKKLRAENTFFYLVRNQAGTLAAQVRFEPDDADRYRVSFSVSQPFRGKSFSSHILRYAINTLEATKGKVKLKASVKKENTASMKCFRRVGFTPVLEDSEKTEFLYET